MTRSAAIEAVPLAMLDQLGLPVFVKNRSGVYTHCSDHFAKFIGRPATQIIGRTAFDISSVALAQTYTQADNALFEAGGVQTYSSMVLRADGSQKRVMFSKYRINEGDDLSLIGTFREVTEENAGVVQFQASHKEKILSDEELKFVLDQSRAMAKTATEDSILNQLTKRELQILRFIAHGLSSKQMARELLISEHTVNDYVKALRGKFGVSSKMKLVIMAHHMGVV